MIDTTTFKQPFKLSSVLTAMYEKKAKKEVKLHPLLGGFTGKQKC